MRIEKRIMRLDVISSSQLKDVSKYKSYDIICPRYIKRRLKENSTTTMKTTIETLIEYALDNVIDKNSFKINYTYEKFYFKNFDEEDSNNEIESFFDKGNETIDRSSHALITLSDQTLKKIELLNFYEKNDNSLVLSFKDLTHKYRVKKKPKCHYFINLILCAFCDLDSKNISIALWVHSIMLTASKCFVIISTLK